MTGLEYEYLVAQYLRENGYSNVEVTKGSGDQGVDVLAHKDGHKYAVQCKYYSSNVGNSAIQEVVAGMAYWGCDMAMVVTNSSYTRSARELARCNDVILLEYINSSSVNTSFFPKSVFKRILMIINLIFAFSVALVPLDSENNISSSATLSDNIGIFLLLSSPVWIRFIVFLFRKIKKHFVFKKSSVIKCILVLANLFVAFVAASIPFDPENNIPFGTALFNSIIAFLFLTTPIWVYLIVRLIIKIIKKSINDRKSSATDTQHEIKDYDEKIDFDEEIDYEADETDTEETGIFHTIIHLLIDIFKLLFNRNKTSTLDEMYEQDPESPKFVLSDEQFDLLYSCESITSNKIQSVLECSDTTACALIEILIRDEQIIPNPTTYDNQTSYIWKYYKATAHEYYTSGESCKDHKDNSEKHEIVSISTDNPKPKNVYISSTPVIHADSDEIHKLLSKNNFDTTKEDLDILVKYNLFDARTLKQIFSINYETACSMIELLEQEEYVEMYYTDATYCKVYIWTEKAKRPPDESDG